MELISTVMVDKFLQRNIIVPEKRELYKTGVMLILADIINISLVLLIGILMKPVHFGLVYLTVFWIVRRFSGGFHAKTYGLCRLVTVGTFVWIVLICKVVSEYRLICSIFCDMSAITAMLIFAPVKHPNKDLTEKEIRGNRLFSLITTFFFSFVSLVLVLLHRKEGLVISLTLFAIAVLMVIGVATNRGREAMRDV